MSADCKSWRGGRRNSLGHLGAFGNRLRDDRSQTLRVFLGVLVSLHLSSRGQDCRPDRCLQRLPSVCVVLLCEFTVAAKQPLEVCERGLALRTSIRFLLRHEAELASAFVVDDAGAERVDLVALESSRLELDRLANRVRLSRHAEAVERIYPRHSRISRFAGVGAGAIVEDPKVVGRAKGDVLVLVVRAVTLANLHAVWPRAGRQHAHHRHACCKWDEP